MELFRITLAVVKTKTKKKQQKTQTKTTKLWINSSACAENSKEADAWNY